MRHFFFRMSANFVKFNFLKKIELWDYSYDLYGTLRFFLPPINIKCCPMPRVFWVLWQNIKHFPNFISFLQNGWAIFNSAPKKLMLFPEFYFPALSFSLISFTGHIISAKILISKEIRNKKLRNIIFSANISKPLFLSQDTDLQGNKKQEVEEIIITMCDTYLKCFP